MSDASLFNRYRDALVDYLSGSGESGLTRAYELGRSVMNEGAGLLQILHAHRKAMTAILDSRQSSDDRVNSMTRSQDFLMEAVSTFDIASRGYLALLEPADRQSQSH
jgi:hypothetical protein